MMLVGEQPGNDEDLAGRPFVGPGGQAARHARSGTPASTAPRPTSPTSSSTSAGSHAASGASTRSRTGGKSPRAGRGSIARSRWCSRGWSSASAPRPRRRCWERSFASAATAAVSSPPTLLRTCSRPSTPPRSCVPTTSGAGTRPSISSSQIFAVAAGALTPMRRADRADLCSAPLQRWIAHRGRAGSAWRVRA